VRALRPVVYSNCNSVQANFTPSHLDLKSARLDGGCALATITACERRSDQGENSFFSAFQMAMATFYSDLVPFLAAAGHEVEVVISQAEYRAGRDLEEHIGHLDRVKIFRTMHWGLQPHNKIHTALVMLLYLVHVAFYSLFGPRVDRNVFLTTPPLLPLWGYLLAKVWQQPYVVVVMDVYPDLVVEYSYIIRNAPLTKLMTWLSTFALQNAATVIAIGRCMADRLAAKGISSERIRIAL
jgi:hypothetical protein